MPHRYLTARPSFAAGGEMAAAKWRRRNGGGEMTIENGYPALVLNADFRPLSYFPLSLWSWQEAIKASFLDRVNIVSEYQRVVHSPSIEMRLPSVIALKDYVHLDRRPAFTRFNLFLRDRFECQYCGTGSRSEDLTFDHLVPRSRGGRTSWTNVLTACQDCNLRKGKFARAFPRRPRARPRPRRHRAARGGLRRGLLYS